MQLTRRQRKRRQRIVVTVIVLGAAVAGGAWWTWGRTAEAETAALPTNDDLHRPPPEGLLSAQQSESASRQNRSSAGDGIVRHEKADLEGAEVASDTAKQESLTAKDDGDEPLAPEAAPVKVAPPRNTKIEAARKRYESGQVIEARHELNAMLKSGLNESQADEARALLSRITDDTIFSRRRIPNDPLIDTYVIQPGDNLTTIGKKYDVPYEILMRINGIADPTKIRAEQRIKVLRGPFHARISAAQFRLDVYLQDLYVCSFPIGLGANGSTPRGEWRVKDRLPNPTYYPSASAEEKRIIPADDPANPLGEHWIGLEGTSGETLGQRGFGIHGTIEPDSIGKAVSLGCVRMHNKDVEFLYGLMLPGRSNVTTLP